MQVIQSVAGYFGMNWHEYNQFFLALVAHQCINEMYQRKMWL